MPSNTVADLSVKLSGDIIAYEATMNAAPGHARRAAKGIKNEFSKLASEIKSDIASLGGGFGKVLLAGGPLAAAAGATATAILSVKKAYEDTLAVTRASKAFGISTEEMSRLSYAGKRSGLDPEEVTKELTHIQRAIGDAADGSKEKAKAFKELGLDADRLSAMSLPKAMEELSVAFAHVGNRYERVHLAFELFGRQGADALRMLDDLKNKMAATPEGQLVTRRDAENAQSIKTTMRELNDLTAGTGKTIMRGWSELARDAMSVLGGLKSSFEGGFQYFGEGYLQVRTHFAEADKEARNQAMQEEEDRKAIEVLTVKKTALNRLEEAWAGVEKAEARARKLYDPKGAKAADDEKLVSTVGDKARAASKAIGRSDAEADADAKRSENAARSRLAAAEAAIDSARAEKEERREIDSLLHKSMTRLEKIHELTIKLATARLLDKITPEEYATGSKNLETERQQAERETPEARATHRMEEEGLRMMEESLTPQEKAFKKYGDLERLSAKGVIDDTTFQRESKRLAHDWTQAEGGNERGINSGTFGSQQAYSTMLAATSHGGSMDQQHLAELKAHTGIARESAQKIDLIWQIANRLQNTFSVN